MKPYYKQLRDFFHEMERKGLLYNTKFITKKSIPPSHRVFSRGAEWSLSAACSRINMVRHDGITQHSSVSVSYIKYYKNLQGEYRNVFRIHSPSNLTEFYLLFNKTSERTRRFSFLKDYIESIINPSFFNRIKIKYKYGVQLNSFPDRELL